MDFQCAGGLSVVPNRYLARAEELPAVQSLERLDRPDSDVSDDSIEPVHLRPFVDTLVDTPLAHTILLPSLLGYFL